MEKTCITGPLPFLISRYDMLEINVVGNTTTTPLAKIRISILGDKICTTFVDVLTWNTNLPNLITDVRKETQQTVTQN